MRATFPGVSQVGSIADAVETMSDSWDIYRSDAITDAAVVAERFSQKQYGEGLIAVLGL